MLYYFLAMGYVNNYEFCTINYNFTVLFTLFHQPIKLLILFFNSFHFIEYSGCS